MASRMRVAAFAAMAWALGAGCAIGQNEPAPQNPGQPIRARACPLPLEAEVAARPPVQCNMPQQFIPRSLWNANLWPGGTVYYEFDANVTQPNRDAMRLAMDELETVAHISFIVRTNQANYVHAQNSSGNNSLVGMVGGEQTVNIYNWDYQYIMEHELMHALGVWHEQSRSDRAAYVNVNYANIQSTYSNNFDIVSSAANVGAFDFESIMLYDACAFSTCCPAGFTCGCGTACAAMQALPAYAQYQNTMGNRSYLSAGDKAGLVSRYGAPVDDSREPNNTLATAKPLSAGSFSLRLIDSDDYFSVTIASTSTLQIVETHPEADVNVALTLLTSAGATLQTVNTSTGTNSISRSVDAGTYIIRVQRMARWGAAYTLSIAGCNAPTITTQPSAGAPCLGGTAQFLGAATDAGAAPFAFTWIKDGAYINSDGRFTITPSGDGRSSTLTITGILASDAGQYSFTAANSCAFAASNSATLSIASPPQATIQGAIAKPCRWGTQTYTASPGGPGSFTYRWQISDDLNRTSWRDLADGPVTIIGVANAATAAGSAAGTLTLSNLSLYGSNVASFRVVATGSCSASTSSALNLYVCAADFDCNGTLAVTDIFAYLNAWFAGDPHTDINASPGLQVGDIFAFFGIWFNGCP